MQYRKYFRLLAKSLGEKSGKTDDESDAIAWIRIFFILQAVVTNLFIISGVIRHWSD